MELRSFSSAVSETLEQGNEHPNKDNVTQNGESARVTVEPTDRMNVNAPHVFNTTSDSSNLNLSRPITDVDNLSRPKTDVNNIQSVSEETIEVVAQCSNPTASASQLDSNLCSINESESVEEVQVVDFYTRRSHRSIYVKKEKTRDESSTATFSNICHNNNFSRFVIGNNQLKVPDWSSQNNGVSQPNVTLHTLLNTAMTNPNAYYHVFLAAELLRNASENYNISYGELGITGTTGSNYNIHEGVAATSKEYRHPGYSAEHHNDGSVFSNSCHCRYKNDNIKTEPMSPDTHNSEESNNYQDLPQERNCNMEPITSNSLPITSQEPSTEPIPTLSLKKGSNNVWNVQNKDSNTNQNSNSEQTQDSLMRETTHTIDSSHVNKRSLETTLGSKNGEISLIQTQHQNQSSRNHLMHNNNAMFLSSVNVATQDAALINNTACLNRFGNSVEFDNTPDMVNKCSRSGLPETNSKHATSRNYFSEEETTNLYPDVSYNVVSLGAQPAFTSASPPTSKIPNGRVSSATPPLLIQYERVPSAAPSITMPMLNPYTPNMNMETSIIPVNASNPNPHSSVSETNSNAMNLCTNDKKSSLSNSSYIPNIFIPPIANTSEIHNEQFYFSPNPHNISVPKLFAPEGNRFLYNREAQCNDSTSQSQNAVAAAENLLHNSRGSAISHSPSPYKEQQLIHAAKTSLIRQANSQAFHFNPQKQDHPFQLLNQIRMISPPNSQTSREPNGVVSPLSALQQPRYHLVPIGDLQHPGIPQRFVSQNKVFGNQSENVLPNFNSLQKINTKRPRENA